MSLNPVFQRYLEHFGATVPVRDLVARRDEKRLVALRHDVDYDLDVALELAHWEHAAGRRASYYVLHGSPYWSDPLLIEKCLQIVDYGHEVGLHLNLLTLWHRGEITDVEGELARMLERFRKAGLEISGVAAHGDKACYDFGFTNYWPFAELRPEDPARAEARVTAEGTLARESDRSIAYPSDGHALLRPDGKAFPFWSIRLADHGLAYEASRVPADHYFSDSGGTWKRTPDPLTESFDLGRRLVLMHPLYWRAPQRHYYFLSTARSGSKWLARFLDEATSLTARHELALNHRFTGSTLTPEKRTGAGFTDLLASREEARRLIDEARSWSEGLLTDYAEANIYLERFLELLPKGEGTTLVHLHREPRAVVRSLIERGWYNVPFDDRHPPAPVEGWAEMGQLEQSAWYVRDTSERLLDACSHRLVFERMVKDLGYLTEFLKAIGIPVHPRLAARVFSESVNATKVWSVPPVDEWAEEDRDILRRVLGPLEEALGYRKGRRGTGVAGMLAQSRARSRRRPQDGGDNGLDLMADIGRASDLGGLSVKNASLTFEHGQTVARFPARTASYVLLGAGYWHGAKEMPGDYLARLATAEGRVASEPSTAEPAPSPFSALLRTMRGWLEPGQRLGRGPLPPVPWGGWPAAGDRIYTVGVTLAFRQAQGSVRVICLSHDAAGKLLAQRDIGILSPTWPTFRRHFRPDRNAASFNIALFSSRDADACTAVVEELRLASQSESRSGALTPDEVLEEAEAKVRRGGKALPRPRTLLAGLDDLGPQIAALGEGSVRPWNVTIALAEEGLRVSAGPKAGHFLAGGGSWHRARQAPAGSVGRGPACEWHPSPGDRVRGYVRGRIEEGNPPVGVFVLSYDADGRLAGEICVGRLSPTQSTVSFDMPLIADASYFNVAIHLPESSGPILIEDVRLGQMSKAA